MTILAWLRRLWEWAAGHPVVTGAMLLVGVIFSQRVYIRALERKQAKGQADADKAAAALALERTAAKRKEVAARLEEADAAAEDADAAARKAGDSAGRAAERGREIDGRWPLPAILLLVALWSTPAQAENPPPCVPEVPSALTDVLRDVAAGLEGTAKLAVMDGAARIDAYRDERAGLCAERAALLAKAEALARSRELVQAVADLAAQDAATLHTAWQAALKRPPAAPRRWWACIVGGTLTAPLDGEPVAYGVGAGCGVSLW